MNIFRKSNLSIYEFSQTKIKKMKVVILAGGMGTRISEYTKSFTKPIPKPMIQ